MLVTAFLVFAGTAFGLLLPIPSNPIVYSLIVLTLGPLLWCLSGSRALLMLLIIVAAALNVSWTLSCRLPESMSRRDVVVEGVVSDFPRVAGGVGRFRFRVSPDSQTPSMPAEIYLSWYDVVDPPEAGDRWRLLVRLKSPHGAVNPGGFDFEGWLFRNRIGATGYVRDAPLNQRLQRVDPWESLLGMRAALADRLEHALTPHAGMPFVLGLAVGARHHLTNRDWELLRRTGTAHLMAVSGLHVGLAAGLFLIFGRRVGAIAVRLGLPASPHWWGIVWALAGALSYGALAGFPISTLRACCMLILIVFLKWRYRLWTLIEILAGVAVAFVVIDPFTLLSPGFWLSFAAVAVLSLALDPQAAQRAENGRGDLPSQDNGLSGKLAMMIRTQVIVVLGLAPLVAGFFGELALLAPVTNLVAIPLFAIVIVPGALAGTAAVLIAPAIGQPLISAVAELLAGFRAILEILAGLEIVVWEPGPVTMLSALLAAWGIVVLIAPLPLPGRMLSVLFLLPLLEGYKAIPRTEDLRVIVFDVGQGLSVLVQTSQHNLLYDAGPRFRGSDAGALTIVPSLRKLGVEHLDTIIVSHADSDHSGGLHSIAERFDAPVIFGAESLYGDATDLIDCRGGMKWHWDGVSFEILHPDRPDQWSDNNRSCVLLVRGRRGSVMLPGDIEASVEALLSRQKRLLPVDLVIAPHHGSRSSSTSSFVAATRPSYVVFATGYQNRWGFPDDAVRRRWEDIGACALATADTGALTFESTHSQSLQIREWGRHTVLRPWLRSRDSAKIRCRRRLPTR